MEQYRKNSHAVFFIKYHVIVLERRIAYQTRELIRQDCESRRVTILQESVRKDHIHLLVSYPPSITPSKIMQLFWMGGLQKEGRQTVLFTSLSALRLASFIMYLFFPNKSITCISYHRFSNAILVSTKKTIIVTIPTTNFSKLVPKNCWITPTSVIGNVIIKNTKSNIPPKLI